MNTSAAAKEDVVNVLMPSSALGAGLGAVLNAQVRIACVAVAQVGDERFQASGGLAAVGEQNRSPLARRRNTPSAWRRNSTVVTVFMEVMSKLKLMWRQSVTLVAQVLLSTADRKVSPPHAGVVHRCDDEAVHPLARASGSGKENHPPGSPRQGR